MFNGFGFLVFFIVVVLLVLLTIFAVLESR